MSALERFIVTQLENLFKETNKNAFRALKLEQFNRSGVDTQRHSGLVILGLGGIGSNVVDTITSIPEITSVLLVDDDVVELSNLNRTAYNYSDIGKPKTLCCYEIIERRNRSISTFMINDRLDTETMQTIIESEDDDKYTEYRLILNAFITSLESKSTYIGYEFIVVDCRDDAYNDYHELRRFFVNIKSTYGNHRKISIIRGAYDGNSITIDPKPENSPVWTNTQAGYQEVVSHGLPSRMIALLLCNTINEITIGNANTSDIPLTYNCRNTELYTRMGKNLMRLFKNKTLLLKLVIACGLIEESNVDTDTITEFNDQLDTELSKLYYTVLGRLVDTTNGSRVYIDSETNRLAAQLILAREGESDGIS